MIKALLTIVGILIRVSLGGDSLCQVSNPLTNLLLACQQCFAGNFYNYATRRCQAIQTCEAFQSTQINPDNTTSCVSICDEKSISIPSSSGTICSNQTFNCLKTYMQPSQISQGQLITNTLKVNNDTAIVLYTNFMNLVSLLDGRLITTYTFPSNISFIKLSLQIVYLFSNDGGIYQWKLSNRTPSYLLTQGGAVNNKNDIIQCFLRGDRIMTASFQDSLKQLVLTQITSPTVQLIYQYPYKAFIQNNFVIGQNNNYQVMIMRVESGSKKLTLNPLTTTYLCSKVNGDFNQIIEQLVSVFYLVTFQNTNGIARISITNQTCTFIETDLIPIKMNLTPNPISSGNLLLTIWKANVLRVIFDDGSSPDISISLDYPPIDFDFYWITNSPSSLLKIYIQNSNHQVEIYALQFDTSKKTYQPLILATTVTTLISQPAKLVMVRGTTINQSYALVLSQDIQIINVQKDFTNGLMINFQQKTFQAESTINKIILNEGLNVLVSCSQDGKAQIWNTSDLNNPLLHYSLEQPNQSCLNVVLDPTQNMLVTQFTNAIVVMNIYSKKIVQTMTINSGNPFTNLQLQNNSIVIIMNSQVIIFNNSQITLTANLPANLNLVNSFMSQPNILYLVDSSQNTITAYSLDFTNQIIVQNPTITPFTSTSPISSVFFYQLNSQSISVFLYFQIFSIQKLIQFAFIFQIISQQIQKMLDLLIIVNTKNNQLSTLDENLIANNAVIQLTGSLTSVYQYTVSQYLFVLSTQIANSPYIISLYDESSNILSTISQQQTLPLLSNVRVFSEGAILTPSNFLELNFFSPLGNFMANQALQFSPSKPNFVQVGVSIFTQGQQISYQINNSKNTMSYIGNPNGQLQYSSYSEDNNASIQKIFNISKNSQISNDAIQLVKYSFRLGYYYVLCSQNVFAFSVATNTMVENISVPSIGSEILMNMIISESNNLIIIYSSTQIFVRNYTDSSNHQLKVTDKTSLFKSINGVSFVESSQILFIYGTTLAQSDIAFKSVKKLPTLGETSFTQCLFLTTTICCKHDTNYVTYYSYASSKLTLVQALQFSPPYIQSFTLDSDSTFENIFLISSVMDVFSFSGAYKATLSQINQNVIYYNFTNSYLVVFTLQSNKFQTKNLFLISYILNIKAAFIVNRKTLNIDATFSPSGGGSLQKGFILLQINVLAFLTNSITYGQIQLYNLQTLQPMGSLLSSYSGNLIGAAIKPIYDPNVGGIVFVDLYGNIYNNRFGQQQNTIDSVAMIEEINSQQTPSPKDFFIDFNLNDMFIHNGVNLWRLNYNSLTRSYLSFTNINRKFYFLLASNAATLNTIPITEVYYCDDLNKIFYYNQTASVFVKQMNENIIEMKSFVQFNTVISIIVFQNRLQVYLNEIKSLDYFDFTINLYLQQFLLTQNDAAILLTQDHQVINYDFSKQKVIYQFSINQNCFISTTMWNSDANRKTYWNLYLILSNGQIIKYDILNSSFQVFNIPPNYSSDLINQSLSLNNGVIILTMVSGNLVEVNGSDFTPLTNQILNGYVQQINSQMNTIDGKPYTLVKYDSLNDVLYLSVNDNKYVGLYNVTNGYSLMTYLIFPDSVFKKILITNKLILLYSSFQINIYSRINYSYIGNYRQSIRQYQITDITEIYENILTISYLTSFQMIVINDQTKNILQVTLNIVGNTDMLYYVTSQDTLTIIGISNTGIIHQDLSINYIYSLVTMKETNTLVLSNTSMCLSVLSYQNQIQITNDFYKLQNFQYQSNSMQYSVSVYIGNEINDMSFFPQNNFTIILRPVDPTNNQLNIETQSFFNVPFGFFYLSNFQFNLLINGTPMSFHINSFNVTLQNITISNQSLLKGTIINFTSETNVQLLNMNITNLTLTTTPTNRRQLAAVDKTYVQQSLLTFRNCTYLLIQNLTISNVTQMSSLFAMIQINTTATVVIKNLIITNSVINGNLINFYGITTLTLNNILITNCQSTTIQNQKTVPWFMIVLYGVQVTQIQSFVAANNTEVNILQADNYYDQGGVLYTYETSALNLQNSVFFNNTYPNSFNKDTQLNLLFLSTPLIYLINVTFSQNQGNIMIYDTNSLMIDQSIFTNNKNVNGGAMQMVQITNYTLMNNTIFTNNIALANGGAISFLDSNYTIMTNSCTLSQNTALIGGAIRIQISQLKNIKMLKEMVLNATIVGNSASIIGNNIGTYPTHFTLSQHFLDTKGQTSRDSLQLYQGSLLNPPPSTLQNSSFQYIQSGGSLYISLKLQDDDGRLIDLSVDSIQQNIYPQTIIDELSSYSIEFIGASNSSDIEIKGESLITARQYNQILNTFEFNNLLIGGFPTSNSDQAKVVIKINDWIPLIDLGVSLEFRICLAGEVPVQLTQDVLYCTPCNEGTYSIIQFTNDQFNKQQPLSQYDTFQCHKCPVGVSNCEKNELVLKQGYWRVNNNTDIIAECNNINPEICDEQQENFRLGCKEGHIGPLCESCDHFARVWDHSYSDQSGLFQCQLCTDLGSEIFFLILTFTFIVIYLCYSISRFITNFQLNSTATYLRLIKILPFSKSCIQDEKSFIVKSFVNYLQLQSILLNFEINDITVLFSNIVLFGKPTGRVSISLQCFYPWISKAIHSENVIQINYMLYTVFPVSLLLTVLLLFAIKGLISKFKCSQSQNNIRFIYYCFIIIHSIFFFFQPDSINYLTSSYVCEQIGNGSYLQNDLTVLCDDYTYQKFKYFAITPLLLFWVAFPLVVLFLLNRDYKKKKNELYFCTMKYKYGYYYLEYKQNYYYWEFIRVYFKILIVLIYTLINQNDVKQTSCIVILGVYLYLVEAFKPFQSTHLESIERNSLIGLIFTTFFALIYNQYQQLVVGLFVKIVHVIITASFLYIILSKRIKLIIFKFQTLISKILKKNILSSMNSSQYIQKNTLKTLSYWRQIYVNLKYLRGLKINEHIKKLEESVSMNQNRTSQVKLKQGSHQSAMSQDLINHRRFTLKFNTNSQNFVKQQTPEAELNTQCSKAIQNLGSIFSKQKKSCIDSPQDIFYNSSKKLITATITDEDVAKQQLIRQQSDLSPQISATEEYRKKETEQTTTQQQKTEFPPIDTDDFEELFSPVGAYRLTAQANNLN